MEHKDETLVAQCLKGERHAYNALVQKYQRAAFGLAFSFVHNADDASDVVQDAFVSVYLNLEQLKDPERFGGWFRTILANRAKKWYRSRREHVALTSAHVELGEKAVNRFAQDEYRQGIWEQVWSLDEIYSVPVTLFYGSGLSYEDIAAFLDVPVSTVRGRLQKARQKLRDVLTEDLNMTPIDVSENVQEEICKIARAEIYEEIDVGKHKHLALFLDISATVSVVGGAGDKVVIRGHKVAIGETEEKATIALDNIKVKNDDVPDWIAEGQHTGERFGGSSINHGIAEAIVNKSGGPVGTFNGKSERFMGAFQVADVFTHLAPAPQFLDAVKQDVPKGASRVSVVTDRMIDIYLPKEAVNGEILEGLWINNTSKGVVHGPVGRMVLEVAVPPRVAVTIQGGEGATIDGVQGNVVCLKGKYKSIGNVGGNVNLVHAFVKKLENISGNVRVFEHNHANNSGDAKPSQERTMRVDGVGGNLQSDTGYIHLDLKNVFGSLDVQNRMGNTTLEMIKWSHQARCRVQTIAGDIALNADKVLMQTRSIAGVILVGTMDYRRVHDVIPAFQQANNQQMRYFSTVEGSGDHWRDADIFLTSERGHLEVKHVGKGSLKVYERDRRIKRNERVLDYLLKQANQTDALQVAFSDLRIDLQKEGKEAIHLRGVHKKTGLEALIKVGANKKDIFWTNVLNKQASDLIPRLFATGEHLGDVKMGWIANEAAPYQLADVSWEGKQFDLMVEAGVKFQKVARSVDLPNIKKVNAQLIEHCLKVGAQKGAPGPISDLLAQVNTHWNFVFDRCGVEICHGDFRLSNAVSMTPPPEGIALLIDFEPLHQPWAFDAACLQILSVKSHVEMVPQDLVFKMAEKRKAFDLPVCSGGDLEKVAAISLAWMAVDQWRPDGEESASNYQSVYEEFVIAGAKV